MRLPAYWSRATAEEQTAGGNKASFSCWRWSDVNQQDAYSAALAAARRILHRLLAGERLDRYAYGVRPLREEVLERFTDSSGTLLAAITRNAWGALVLNTSGLMFIDIDFKPTSPMERFRYFLRKWLDRSAVSPELARELQAVERLAAFVRDRPHWSVRVYRTAVGQRAAATHDVFDPASGETRALLEAAGSDPLYTNLCRDQECFRARLTPKPWRCRHDACPARWPFESQEDHDAFDFWQTIYLEKQSRCATCRYLDTLGERVVRASFSRLIELHDQLTRANEPLELA